MISPSSSMRNGNSWAKLKRSTMPPRMLNSPGANTKSRRSNPLISKNSIKNSVSRFCPLAISMEDFSSSILSTTYSAMAEP